MSSPIKNKGGYAVGNGRLVLLTAVPTTTPPTASYLQGDFGCFDGNMYIAIASGSNTAADWKQFDKGGLADDEVTTAKIAGGAVTNAKLADDAVNLGNIAPIGASVIIGSTAAMGSASPKALSPAEIRTIANSPSQTELTDGLATKAAISHGHDDAGITVKAAQAALGTNADDTLDTVVSAINTKVGTLATGLSFKGNVKIVSNIIPAFATADVVLDTEFTDNDTAVLASNTAGLAVASLILFDADGSPNIRKVASIQAGTSITLEPIGTYQVSLSANEEGNMYAADKYYPGAGATEDGTATVVGVNAGGTISFMGLVQYGDSDSLTEGSTNLFATSAEKSTWNGKQDAIGDNSLSSAKINIPNGGDYTNIGSSNNDDLPSVLAGIDTTLSGKAGTAAATPGTDGTDGVDGLMSDADKFKLDNVEASATADQTGAEIKTAYELEANTNAFTDAEQSKLSAIAASANNYSHPATHNDGEIQVASAQDVLGSGINEALSSVIDKINTKVGANIKELSFKGSVKIVSDLVAPETDPAVDDVVVDAFFTDNATANAVSSAGMGVVADDLILFGADSSPILRQVLSVQAGTSITLKKANDYKTELSGTDLGSLYHTDKYFPGVDAAEDDAACLVGVDSLGAMRKYGSIDGLDLEEVFASIDTAIAGKQGAISDSDAITEGSTNLFFTSSEKSKLSAIEASANNYSHPATHGASDLASDAVTTAKIASDAVTTDKLADQARFSKSSIGTTPVYETLIPAVADQGYRVTIFAKEGAKRVMVQIRFFAVDTADGTVEDGSILQSIESHEGGISPLDLVTNEPQIDMFGGNFRIKLTGASGVTAATANVLIERV